MAISSGVKVTGPIPIATRANPFGAAMFDVGEYGYVEEEYFFEGEAVAYEPVPGSKLSVDGRWQVRAARTAPFKARILVERPIDSAVFSGTVFVSWSNVSAGFEVNWEINTPIALQRGDVWVVVSAQKVGYDGVPGGEASALRAWDPQRYGSLHHPGDDFSFDVLTKAAQIVGRDRDGVTPDPLGGLEVQRVLVTGASQSGMRLNTYINAVQPLTHAFDGFLPVTSFGRVVRLDTSDVPVSDFRRAHLEHSVRIRDDLDVPVIALSTESEADSLYQVRQPDTDKIRTWEVAGAAHVGGAPEIAYATKLFIRDGLMPTTWVPDVAVESAIEPNDVVWRPVWHAACVHLARWAADGTLPPSYPLIDFEGDPPHIKRDNDGNATGGIRVPEMEAPVAEYRAAAPDGNLGGTMKRFSPDELKGRYATRAGYVSEWAAAVDRGVDAGYILAVEAASIKHIGMEKAAALFP